MCLCGWVTDSLWTKCRNRQERLPARKRGAGLTSRVLLRPETSQNSPSNSTSCSHTLSRPQGERSCLRRRPRRFAKRDNRSKYLDNPAKGLQALSFHFARPAPPVIVAKNSRRRIARPSFHRAHCTTFACPAQGLYPVQASGKNWPIGSLDLTVFSNLAKI